MIRSKNKIFYNNFFPIKLVLFLDYKNVIFSLIFTSQGNWTPQPGQSPDCPGLSTALSKYKMSSPAILSFHFAFVFVKFVVGSANVIFGIFAHFVAGCSFSTVVQGNGHHFLAASVHP